MFILDQTKQVTFTTNILELINEMIDQFLFYVEEARKLEFESNLQSIQTGIDKITREITNIKESGNWYLRKKKKSEKNFDEKEIMYISDLIKQLPNEYLVGVWEILEERPFMESSKQNFLSIFLS